MSQGAVATVLAGAAALGAEFPDTVPDTPGNRRLFERIKAEIAAMPDGVVVDLPHDYTD